MSLINALAIIIVIVCILGMAFVESYSLNKKAEKVVVSNDSITQQNTEPRNKTSTIILNIIWIILGGLITSIGWILSGILWCITIIGIPLGKQCFKFAKLTFAPFGKDIVYTNSGVKTIVNIIWILVTGLVYAISFAILGVICYITIIGIPFGKQYMKFAKLSLMPFGAKIINK